MAPSKNRNGSGKGTRVAWRPTKVMNMRDLSRDDDFLSHLLVEKLGNGAVPLLVHKMDPSRRLPKTDAEDLLRIVQQLVVVRQSVQQAVGHAVDELLSLPPVRYYLKSYMQKQINAFATHASRYFELYHPSGVIEIAHTSRYSHRTGKSELCILATRNLPTGTVITELKGSMAHLTEEEDRELKRTDLRNSDIRRDFSVIHSKSMKKNHLFLGPARFVNHDCNNNCELFREGKYITFRTLRPISMGEEVTAHYGDTYFGRKNRHCLCATCESLGRGGYAPDRLDEDSDADLDSQHSGSGSGTSDTEEESEGEAVDKPSNLNERRTRRGVYAVMREHDEDTDESEEDGADIPLADAKDIPADEDMELETVEVKPEIVPLPSTPASISTRSRSAKARERSLSPPPSVSTDTPVDWLPDPFDADAPGVVEFPSGLTPDQRDRLRRKWKRILWDRTQRAVRSSHKKGRNRQLLYKLYEENLVKHRLNTPPPEPSEAATPPRRLTRSQTRLEPSQVKNLPDASSSRRKEKGRDQMMGVDSTRSTPTTDRRSRRRGGNTGDKQVQLVTPPLSEDTASLPETSASSQRVTRSSSRAKVSKAGNSQADSATKKLDQISSSKPLVSALPDPRIPTCGTCRQIIPVISVDSKVVFGAESSPRRTKKNQVLQECPRCMRHFAIYGERWPVRMSAHGVTSLPTPREGTPVEAPPRRMTQKSSATLDPKLSNASRHQERQPDRQRKTSNRSDSNRDPSKERPNKKRKIDPMTTPMKDNSKLSHEGRTRSGRLSLPTPKSQRSETENRKRGRPRLPSSERQASPPEDEHSLKLKSLAVQSQPRDGHGRFGKKASTNGMYMRKRHSTKRAAAAAAMSRSERAIQRSKVKLWLEQKEAASRSECGETEDISDDRGRSAKRKRIDEGEGEEDDSPLEATHTPYSNDSGDATASKSMRSLVFSSFRGLGLSFSPNPLSFAQRKWTSYFTQAKSAMTWKDSNQINLGHSLNESDLHAVSEDNFSLLVEDSGSQPSGTLGRRDRLSAVDNGRGASLRVSSLTHKPSPFNFARRRWASLGDTPGGNQKEHDILASQREEEFDLDVLGIADEPSKSGPGLRVSSSPTQRADWQEQSAQFELSKAKKFDPQFRMAFEKLFNHCLKDAWPESASTSPSEVSFESDDGTTPPISHNDESGTNHAFFHNSNVFSTPTHLETHSFGATSLRPRLVFAGWDSSPESSPEL